MKKNHKGSKRQDMPAIDSIRDQKKRAQNQCKPMTGLEMNSPHSARQNRPHRPMARENDSLQTPKKPRMPLYSPSRFR